MSTLRSWYLDGRSMFVARLAGTGAVAGVVAWVLHRLLREFLGREPLGMLGLLLAVLRGAALGAILALILSAYWEWASRRSGGKDA